MGTLGAMQDFPLRIMRLMDHAEREHGTREIVAARADGTTFRTDWRRTAHDARRMAQALERIGIRPGDRVATLGMNHDRHLTAWFGVVGAGGVLHTVNPRLFDDLLSAFAQDVTTRRYETWDAVLDYCRRSANPVGRLVLGIAGVHGETAVHHSDAVCTALQLTNFWQDLGDDWRTRDRLYVPAELLREHGADPHALDGASAGEAWRRVVGVLGIRTDALFTAGHSLLPSAK